MNPLRNYWSFFFLSAIGPRPPRNTFFFFLQCYFFFRTDAVLAWPAAFVWSLVDRPSDLHGALTGKSRHLVWICPSTFCFFCLLPANSVSHSPDPSSTMVPATTWWPSRLFEAPFRLRVPFPGLQFQCDLEFFHPVPSDHHCVFFQFVSVCVPPPPPILTFAGLQNPSPPFFGPKQLRTLISNKG